jgi:hypothetical protein
MWLHRRTGLEQPCPSRQRLDDPRWLKQRKIMNRTNDTVNRDHDTRDDHGTLADTELNAATAGTLLRGSQQGERKGGRYLGQV